MLLIGTIAQKTFGALWKNFYKDFSDACNNYFNIYEKKEGGLEEYFLII